MNCTQSYKVSIVNPIVAKQWRIYINLLISIATIVMFILFQFFIKK